MKTAVLTLFALSLVIITSEVTARAQSRDTFRAAATKYILENAPARPTRTNAYFVPFERPAPTRAAEQKPLASDTAGATPPEAAPAPLPAPAPAPAPTEGEEKPPNGA